MHILSQIQSDCSHTLSEFSGPHARIEIRKEYSIFSIYMHLTVYEDCFLLLSIIKSSQLAEEL